MALKLLKFPISRCCSRSTTSSTCISSTSCGTTFFFFSKSSTNTPLLSVRWHKAHMHFPIRSFVTANKSGKVQLKKKKKRLDEICLERFQQYSRTFIQSWILQGKVFVDGKLVNKAGTPVSDEAVVEIMAEVPKYV
ncbi:hypothetical protein CsSME_00015975 [Camellia sinensis var. sinensis]